MSSNDDNKIGYWETVSIGVGGMVGGGIFAVLGLAVELAHGGTPVAFLIAGIVAFITTYAYSKLSTHFPSQGGTVFFLDQAFGVDLFTGSINNLLWLSYIIMLALYSYAFGSYGATFFHSSHQLLIKHIIISLGIIVPTILNMLNAKVIGKAEQYVVAIKIALLLFFVAVGFQGINTQRITVQNWSPSLQLVSGGMIIFLAYEGFELIANTAKDVKDMKRTLPRAFYSAVIFVIALYILVSIVSVGSLPVDKIVQAKDYALAAAAKPFLGSAGFTLIAVAALLSTFSAINATLYGSARLSYTIAKEGELPEFLEDKVWNKPLEGLIITAVLALFLANIGDLSSISMMGSAGFLIIFAAVNAANVKLAKKTESKSWISILGIILCTFALIALIWQTAENRPAHLWVLIGMILLSAGIELTYSLFKKRKFKFI
ncbi:MAG TPA: APC family permease [Balneolales bacterium]|nr:APC family permease [Balneolales bacterium]